MIAENGVATAPAADALPLFYSKPEAMNPDRHGSLGLAARADFSFTRAAHALPVVTGEMPAAMRSYPIVFVGPANQPVVITGLRQGENLFVDKDGQWAKPHYIPAYARRYPFILADDGGQGSGRLALCVDRASDRVVEQAAAHGDKVAPFFAGTEATEATKQALAFCNQYQMDFAATRTMVDKIAAHGLFVERRSTVTLENGEVLNLTDFKVIDEDAFNKLGDEAFLDLRKSGALTLVYCHLASTNSWSSVIHQAALHKVG
ncbi:SapC family protein [Mesorhizobium sp. NPDC059054]|uniref:SapC family protein n=1 Tax=Mesorhizobium sp. NPDC059054 TaxID=3346711 RepID=UPI0036C25F1B